MTFWRHIAVVEAVVGSLKFFKEFKGHVDTFECVFDGIGTIIPGTLQRAGTKGITAGSPKRMPVTDTEAE